MNQRQVIDLYENARGIQCVPTSIIYSGRLYQVKEGVDNNAVLVDVIIARLNEQIANLERECALRQEQTKRAVDKIFELEKELNDADNRDCIKRVDRKKQVDRKRPNGE